MNSSRLAKAFSSVALLVGLAILLGVSPATATPSAKVAASVASMTLNLGGTQNVNLSLDAPIICPGGTVVCEVSIDFSAAFPAGISVQPSSVTWTQSQWTQMRAIQVSVDSNATSVAGQVYSSTATVTSASQYYDNYLLALAVDIPPVQVEDAEPVSSLANTGSNSGQLFEVGAAVLAFGVLIRIISIKKSKR